MKIVSPQNKKRPPLFFFAILWYRKIRAIALFESKRYHRIFPEQKASEKQRRNPIRFQAILT